MQDSSKRAVEPTGQFVLADAAPLRVPDGDLRWVVLHARPRCEKKLASLCRAEGIETFLPLRMKVRTYGARVRRFTSPLFPGYLFCLGDTAQRRFLKQNQHVARCLEVADQGRLVDTLNAIRRALAVGEVADVFPFLKEGVTVRITDGPLQGVEGIVDRWKDRSRIIINVEMIQQSVAIEVEAQFLAAV